jgi:hypothetical protein
LIFESKFESGNLFLAQKVSDGEYNLMMQNDINTIGHTQWFYFRTENTKQGQSVKFNIINFVRQFFSQTFCIGENGFTFQLWHEGVSVL